MDLSLATEEVAQRSMDQNNLVVLGMENMLHGTNNLSMSDQDYLNTAYMKAIEPKFLPAILDFGNQISVPGFGVSERFLPTLKRLATIYYIVVVVGDEKNLEKQKTINIHLLEIAGQDLGIVSTRLQALRRHLHTIYRMTIPEMIRGQGYDQVIDSVCDKLIVWSSNQTDKSLRDQIALTDPQQARDLSLEHLRLGRHEPLSIDTVLNIAYTNLAHTLRDMILYLWTPKLRSVTNQVDVEFLLDIPEHLVEHISIDDKRTAVEVWFRFFEDFDNARFGEHNPAERFPGFWNGVDTSDAIAKRYENYVQRLLLRSNGEASVQGNLTAGMICSRMLEMFVYSSELYIVASIPKPGLAEQNILKGKLQGVIREIANGECPFKIISAVASGTTEETVAYANIVGQYFPGNLSTPTTTPRDQHVAAFRHVWSLAPNEWVFAALIGATNEVAQDLIRSLQKKLTKNTPDRVFLGELQKRIENIVPKRQVSVGAANALSSSVAEAPLQRNRDLGRNLNESVRITLMANKDFDSLVRTVKNVSTSTRVKITPAYAKDIHHSIADLIDAPGDALKEAVEAFYTTHDPNNPLPDIDVVRSIAFQKLTYVVSILHFLKTTETILNLVKALQQKSGESQEEAALQLLQLGIPKADGLRAYLRKTEQELVSYLGENPLAACFISNIEEPVARFASFLEKTLKKSRQSYKAVFGAAIPSQVGSIEITKSLGLAAKKRIEECVVERFYGSVDDFVQALTKIYSKTSVGTISTMGALLNVELKFRSPSIVSAFAEPEPEAQQLEAAVDVESLQYEYEDIVQLSSGELESLRDLVPLMSFAARGRVVRALKASPLFSVGDLASRASKWFDQTTLLMNRLKAAHSDEDSPSLERLDTQNRTELVRLAYLVHEGLAENLAGRAFAFERMNEGVRGKEAEIEEKIHQAKVFRKRFTEKKKTDRTRLMCELQEWISQSLADNADVQNALLRKLDSLVGDPDSGISPVEASRYTVRRETLGTARSMSVREFVDNALITIKFSEADWVEQCGKIVEILSTQLNHARASRPRLGSTSELEEAAKRDLVYSQIVDRCMLYNTNTSFITGEKSRVAKSGRSANVFTRYDYIKRSEDVSGETNGAALELLLRGNSQPKRAFESVASHAVFEMYLGVCSHLALDPLLASYLNYLIDAHPAMGAITPRQIAAMPVEAIVDLANTLTPSFKMNASAFLDAENVGIPEELPFTAFLEASVAARDGAYDAGRTLFLTLGRHWFPEKKAQRARARKERLAELLVSVCKIVLKDSKASTDDKALAQRKMDAYLEQPGGPTLSEEALARTNDKAIEKEIKAAVYLAGKRHLGANYKIEEEGELKKQLKLLVGQAIRNTKQHMARELGEMEAAALRDAVVRTLTLGERRLAHRQKSPAPLHPLKVYALCLIVQGMYDCERELKEATYSQEDEGSDGGSVIAEEQDRNKDKKKVDLLGIFAKENIPNPFADETREAESKETKKTKKGKTEATKDVDIQGVTVENILDMLDAKASESDDLSSDSAWSGEASRPHGGAPNPAHMRLFIRRALSQQTSKKSERKKKTGEPLADMKASADFFCFKEVKRSMDERMNFVAKWWSKSDLDSLARALAVHYSELVVEFDKRANQKLLARQYKDKGTQNLLAQVLVELLRFAEQWSVVRDNAATNESVSQLSRLIKGLPGAGDVSWIPNPQNNLETTPPPEVYELYRLLDMVGFPFPEPEDDPLCHGPDPFLGVQRAIAEFEQATIEDERKNNKAAKTEASGASGGDGDETMSQTSESTDSSDASDVSVAFSNSGETDQSSTDDSDDDAVSEHSDATLENMSDDDEDEDGDESEDDMIELAASKKSRKSRKDPSKPDKEPDPTLVAANERAERMKLAALKFVKRAAGPFKVSHLKKKAPAIFEVNIEGLREKIQQRAADGPGSVEIMNLMNIDVVDYWFSISDEFFDDWRVDGTKALKNQSFYPRNVWGDVLDKDSLLRTQRVNRMLPGPFVFGADQISFEASQRALIRAKREGKRGGDAEGGHGFGFPTLGTPAPGAPSGFWNSAEQGQQLPNISERTIYPTPILPGGRKPVGYGDKFLSEVASAVGTLKRVRERYLAAHREYQTAFKDAGNQGGAEDYMLNVKGFFPKFKHIEKVLETMVPLLDMPLQTSVEHIDLTSDKNYTAGFENLLQAWLATRICLSVFGEEPGEFMRKRFVVGLTKAFLQMSYFWKFLGKPGELAQLIVDKFGEVTEDAEALGRRSYFEKVLSFVYETKELKPWVSASVANRLCQLSLTPPAFWPDNDAWLFQAVYSLLRGKPAQPPPPFVFYERKVPVKRSVPGPLKVQLVPLLISGSLYSDEINEFVLDESVCMATRSRYIYTRYVPPKATPPPDDNSTGNGVPQPAATAPAENVAEPEDTPAWGWTQTYDSGSMFVFDVRLDANPDYKKLMHVNLFEIADGATATETALPVPGEKRKTTESADLATSEAKRARIESGSGATLAVSSSHAGQPVANSRSRVQPPPDQAQPPQDVVAPTQAAIPIGRIFADMLSVWRSWHGAPGWITSFDVNFS